MSIIELVTTKIHNNERITEDDALALYESPDLLGIAKIADQINLKRNNGNVFFNINRHINPTNICVLSCKFCAYSRKPGDEGAYAYSIEEMVKKAGEAVAQGATEVHMVGGLHPRWKFSYYVEMLRAIKTAYPDLHIKAFTVVELNWLAQKERRTMKEILTDLCEAGLGSLPGGGAEIFHPEVREEICENKVDAAMWLNTHRLAHQMGLKSNCTMLYGHIENFKHRVDHMSRLRALQDETHGFNAFIPLSFQPENNDMGIKRYTFGYDDLKNIAISRIFLDNFDHIKAYWVMLGQEIAQLATRFGANDLDGTVIEEKISRMAGGRSGMVMGQTELENIIKKAGSKPVERDTLYNVRYPEQLRQGACSQNPEGEAAKLNAIENKMHYGSNQLKEMNIDEMSIDEMIYAARNSSLHDLGEIANNIRNQHNAEGLATFSIEISPTITKESTIGDVMKSIASEMKQCKEMQGVSATTLKLDLAEILPCKDEFSQILEIIWATKQSYSELEITLVSVKGIWTIAQNENVNVKDVLDRLQESGVDFIQSSNLETETDLTHSEVTDLHAQIHSLGIKSIAKVELAAPLKGAGEPNWQSFISRLIHLDTLNKKTNQLLGVSIEISDSSFVTPAEYLRAIAIARIAAPSITNIISPVDKMPSMSPVSHSTHLPKQIPTQKYAPIALLMGANDLGQIPYQTLDIKGLSEEVRATGYHVSLRDAAFVPTAAHELGSLTLTQVLAHCPAPLESVRL